MNSPATAPGTRRNTVARVFRLKLTRPGPDDRPRRAGARSAQPHAPAAEEAKRRFPDQPHEVTLSVA